MPDRTDPAGHLEVNDVLQQSEAMFRLVFEQSSVGMVMVSLDRRFLRCNEAFLRFVGHNQEELVGTDFLDITWHEDRLIGLAEMREIISGNLDRYQAQKRYVRKDGHVVWADVLIALTWVCRTCSFTLPTVRNVPDLP